MRRLYWHGLGSRIELFRFVGKGAALKRGEWIVVEQGLWQTASPRRSATASYAARSRSGRPVRLCASLATKLNAVIVQPLLGVALRARAEDALESDCPVICT